MKVWKSKAGVCGRFESKSDVECKDCKAKCKVKSEAGKHCLVESYSEFLLRAGKLINVNMVMGLWSVENSDVYEY